MKTIINTISTSLLVLTLVSCSQEKETAITPTASEAIPVKVFRPMPANHEEPVNAAGQFTTDDETMLSFKTGGIINRIFVHEGEQVSKGQVLASLDLTEINAMVAQAQVAVEKSRRDLVRVQNLFKDSVATLEQLQNSQSALELSEQQLAAARFNQQYSEIRAVNDGIVIRKLANTGQLAGPGMPVIQTSSKGSGDWILRVALSDREWSRLRAGDSARVQAGADQRVTLRAVVNSKSENADPMTGSFSADLKLTDAKKLSIASGMFGKATIQTSQNSQGWLIPYEALLDGDAGQGFVFVTNDQQVAHRVPVRIERVERNQVLISEGLAGSEQVISSGSAYLSDNSRITIKKQ